MEIIVHYQMNIILKEKLHFGLLIGRKETLAVKRAKDSSVPILISFESFMTAQLRTDTPEDPNVSYYCLQYLIHTSLHVGALLILISQQSSQTTGTGIVN